MPGTLNLIVITNHDVSKSAIISSSGKMYAFYSVAIFKKNNLYPYL